MNAAKRIVPQQVLDDQVARMQVETRDHEYHRRTFVGSVIENCSAFFEGAHKTNFGMSTSAQEKRKFKIQNWNVETENAFRMVALLWLWNDKSKPLKIDEALKKVVGTP